MRLSDEMSFPEIPGGEVRFTEGKVLRKVRKGLGPRPRCSQSMQKLTHEGSR